MTDFDEKVADILEESGTEWEYQMRHGGAPRPMATTEAIALEPYIREREAAALRNAAIALALQPAMLRAEYVATLRLYADEPWRMDGPDDAKS